MLNSADELMIRDAVSTLVMVSNKSRNREVREALMKEFRTEHRTNQQLAGSTIFYIIKDTAEKYDGEDRSRYFDGRNEAFGKHCSEICKHMSTISPYWESLPYI